MSHFMTVLLSERLQSPAEVDLQVQLQQETAAILDTESYEFAHERTSSADIAHFNQALASKALMGENLFRIDSFQIGS